MENIYFMYRTDIDTTTKYGKIKINDMNIKYGYYNFLYNYLMDLLQDYSRIKNIKKINKLYLAINNVITTPTVDNNDNIIFFIDLCGTTKYYILNNETFTIENE